MTRALCLLSVGLALALPAMGPAAFPALLVTVAAVDVALLAKEDDDTPRTWWDIAAHVLRPSGWVPLLLGVWGPHLDVWPAVPVWMAVPVLALVIDAERYVVHRLCHAVPWLWALHHWHHASEAPAVLNRAWAHPLDPSLWSLTGLAAVALGCPLPVLAGAMALHLPAAVQHCHAELREVPGLLLGSHHREHHREGGQAVNLGLCWTVWDRWGGTLR